MYSTNLILQRHAALGVGVLVMLSLTVGAMAEKAFELREHLGREWKYEVVTFSLTADQTRMAQKGSALRNAEGTSVAYQLVAGEPARLAVQTDLPAYGTVVYRFGPGQAATKTDLVLESDDGMIRLGNSGIGIAVRTRLQAGEGPIAGLRLGSGNWTGDSRMDGGQMVENYSATVLQEGPVFVSVEVNAGFADGGSWSMRLWLAHGEPIIRIEERFDAPGGGMIRLRLTGKSFQPSHVLYRGGMGGSLGKVATAELPETGRVHLLEPWLRWWMAERQGNWFSLYTPGPQESQDDRKPDMLMVGAFRADAWKNPDWKGKASQLNPELQAVRRDGHVFLDLPLAGGQRHWLLGTPDKRASLEPLARKNRNVSPLPHDYLIKHGEFPLERVKDYVLAWPGKHKEFPRLFVRKAELPALKERLRKNPVPRKPQLRMSRYNLGGWIGEYLCTGDAELGGKMLETGLQWLQECVERFLDQDVQATLGMAPHMQTQINTTLNLLDVLLGTELISELDRTRALAKIAFLGYVVERSDYWSPERGFRANPNMTTTVATYQAIIGCMLPDHPLGRQWAQMGLKELKHELDTWSDADGGWLEAPHYAMVAYDHILGGFIAAKNAGFEDYVFDPAMRRVMEWLACISTPRNAMTGGFRHYPAIGNTYPGEPTGVFGMMAGLYAEKDPDFAAHMQWFHHEYGKFKDIGVGGFSPTLAGYRHLLRRPDLQPRKPDWGSRRFEKTGVVLRNELGADRETYLHLIAGTNHEHYDYDSGSIVIWGKGRVIADDWGYIGRHPAKWHSMLSSSAAGQGSIMNVNAFAPAPTFDYVSGKKGAWTRQIGFSKNHGAAGSSFFMIRDTHSADTPAEWRLWLMAKELSITPWGARVTGVEDVDCDIFVFQPKGLSLTTENAKLTSPSGYRDGKTGRQTTEQTALKADLKERGAVVIVVYPRLRTAPSPEVDWLAQGRGVKITSPTGEDYVFLAPDRFEWGYGELEFSGSSGAAQLGKKPALTLGAPGRLRKGKRIVEK
ncbi:MAG: hypothetical protein QGI24_02550 [Kiritimatiellia bacterium]|jgi:hypothetical protein|nr:hypothetical protein [Kiritimatiellia bacterium]MDP6847644.1 hypothetical protein [Kiritimatiellia bacterium]